MDDIMYRDIMFIHDIISINTLHLSIGKYVESVQIALEKQDASSSDKG